MLLSEYHQKTLRGVCSAKIDDFRRLATKVVETPHGPAMWIDRGGDTLAVAHLDYVQFSPPEFRGDAIHCPQLDDRLGAWAILDYLPRITTRAYDVLLCDSEEIGQSTAQYTGHTAPALLELPKRYNWAWELDRAGVDTVTYQYQSPAWEDALEEGGFRLGMGSFSDISSLEQLGISCANFGVGYHHQHSPRCYADLRDTLDQCAMVAEFLEAQGGTPFPHVPREDRRIDDWDRYGSDDSATYGLFPCPTCGEPLAWDPSWRFCPLCGNDI